MGCGRIAGVTSACSVPIAVADGAPAAAHAAKRRDQDSVVAWKRASLTAAPAPQAGAALELPRPGAAPLPPVQAALFREAFAALSAEYLHLVADRPNPTADVGHLALRGLTALSLIDPSVQVVRQGDAVELWYHGRRVRSVPAPATGTASAWSNLMASLLDSARVRSATVRGVTLDELYEQVFAQLLAPLDYWTSYYSPTKAAELFAGGQRRSEYGVRTSTRDGELIADEVHAGGPAWRAGVRPGDRILAVGGEAVTPASAERLARRLDADSGAAVSMTLAPNRRVELEAEDLAPASVRGSLREGMAYIEVTSFEKQTAAEFEATLADLSARGARGLVIDLRANMGGFVSSAVGIADTLLTAGPLLEMRGRGPGKEDIETATGGDAFEGRPVVVLVNGQTLSSAELLAAALQQRDRAVVVGSASWGKGVSQALRRLPGGARLAVTYRRAYGPLGIPVHRVGVMPSVCTADGDTARLVADLRQGRTRLPADLGEQMRAAESDRQLADAVQQSCPSRNESPDGDVDVALELLRDPGLYDAARSLMRRALAGAAPA